MKEAGKLREADSKKKVIEFSLEWVARNSTFVWVLVCNLSHRKLIITY